MTDKKLIDYIIDFLIGVIYPIGQQDAGYRKRFDLIGYTRDHEEMKRFPIVIYPSRFFELEVYGTEEAMPHLPLATWRGTPLLFGENKEAYIQESGTLVIYADIIASSYFLISRYEEMYRRSERDEHGRFPGKASLAFRADFVHRPIIDEYGESLRGLIRQLDLLATYKLYQEERPSKLKRVFLTHDLIRPRLQAEDLVGWKRFLRPVLDVAPWLAKRLRFSSIEQSWVLPRGLEGDLKLKRNCGEGIVTSIFFIRSSGKHSADHPSYQAHSRIIRLLNLIARRQGAKIGLLCSYQTGDKPEQIEIERRRLRQAIPGSAECARYTLLAQREPEDMVALYSAGIRHDFTMTYADIGGFRLGTCRSVRFINPNTRLLTDLVMHPISLLDEVLERQDLGQAREYARKTLRLVARYNGELTLSWSAPNLNPQKNPLLSELYKELIGDIYSLIAQACSAETTASPGSSHEEVQLTDPNNEQQYI